MQPLCLSFDLQSERILRGIQEYIFLCRYPPFKSGSPLSPIPPPFGSSPAGPSHLPGPPRSSFWVTVALGGWLQLLGVQREVSGTLDLCLSQLAKPCSPSPDSQPSTPGNESSCLPPTPTFLGASVQGSELVKKKNQS